MSKEIESLFVPYKESLELKELGFDEACLASFNYRTKGKVITLYGCGALLFNVDGLYTNQTEDIICAAPLYTQAFKWFRDKFHIHGESFYKGGLTKKTSWYDYQIYSDIDFKEDKIQYKTYEEAELECLKKLISIVKDKKCMKYQNPAKNI